MAAVGRLKNRKQFLAVKHGECRKGSLFFLEVFDHKNPDSIPRVGFTVTKRQGSAVERNRIRRRFKEIIRLGAVSNVLKPGHDYVVIAKRDALCVPFQKLYACFIERINRKNRLRRLGNVFSRKKP
ncbi:ribonuclease P protein component [Liberibacter sp. Z1]|nr:ribonuclease P protein component [Candidatus Liberibacter sp.]